MLKQAYPTASFRANGQQSRTYKRRLANALARHQEPYKHHRMTEGWFSGLQVWNLEQKSEAVNE